jgi:hypothetical protein
MRLAEAALEAGSFQRGPRLSRSSVRSYSVLEELWGPVFRLNPAFAEVDAFLWGWADFFRRFTITFEEGPTPEFLIEF